jgi:hypothetical protein
VFEKTFDNTKALSENRTPSDQIQLSEEEQKEAEEYKKACEGGKV